MEELLILMLAPSHSWGCNMFSANTLIDKLNTLISSGSLTEEQLLQAFGAIDSLETKGVASVVYEADLPLAANNKGRFFLITSTGRFTFSNGSTWNISNILIPLNVNVYAWGIATNGRLGDNTLANKSSPISIYGNFTDWTQVSAGTAHSLGLRANGTAWAWGYNSLGRLGDGTTVSKTSPVSVSGGFTDWIQLSAGDAHSSGIRANGTAWGWGNNGSGRLGDGTATSKSVPVSVVGGFVDWTQISAGGTHTLGVRANGTAWAWGINTNGRLGDNTIVAKSSPVSVVGGFTDWTQVSAGATHSLGLRANGTAWAWGVNTYGRLGDNSTTSRSSPVSVVGGFTDWIQLSAGYTHSFGLRANGTAWSWGPNLSGRLGNDSGLGGGRSSPGSILGGFTDWVQLAATRSGGLGIRANGTAWAWGGNSYGQLGDGTIVDKSSPISVIGGLADWVQLSGANHSLGVVR